MLVVLVAVVAPFVYIHFIKGSAPKKLSLDPGSASLCPNGAQPDGASGGVVPLAGNWQVASCSEVRYRVKEVLFGQHADAVGATNAVTGKAVIDGTTVKTATFSVDMTKVHSDEPRRDSQFRGRIMAVDQFPTATFELTSPVDLAPVPGADTVKRYEATGKFTAHGVTHDVTVSLQTRRIGNQIGIAGSFPIVFADYGIPNPSFGPASTEDHGEVELQIVLVPTKP